MNRRPALVAVLIFLISSFSACKEKSAEKTIASTKSGGFTVTLSGPNGIARPGENNLVLLIADSNGRGVDFRTVALRFHMPAMTGMAEMNDTATLVTTGTPGRFAVTVRLESGGPWEAIVNFQGSGGSYQATMPVNVGL